MTQMQALDVKHVPLRNHMRGVRPDMAYERLARHVPRPLIIYDPALELELPFRSFVVPFRSSARGSGGGGGGTVLDARGDLFSETPAQHVFRRLPLDHDAAFTRAPPQHPHVTLFRPRHQKTARSALLAGSRGAPYAVQVVVGGEGRVVFDYEVDVWEVETAGGDVCAEEDAGVRGAREGVEGGCSEGLGEGAME